MLTLSPVMKLSRYTLFLLAGMFLLFAVWALFGFAYPAAPIPIALNTIAKMLAFATAVSLFLPVNGTIPSILCMGIGDAVRASHPEGVSHPL